MNEPSPQRLAYLRQRQRKRCLIRALQAGLLVFLLLLWELAARHGAIDAFVVSCPSRVADTLGSLFRSGDLWQHIGTSCLETVLGFTLGTVAGTVIAIGLWWSEWASRILEPYLVVLNALPKTALGPIFIVWIGAGTASIIAMTVAISIIVTILNMHSAFLSTDALFNTLKVNVGLSWVGAIMGEFLVSKAGLGYLIVYGSQVFNMDLVMASILILSVAAVVMYQGVLRLEKTLGNRLGVML